MIAANDLDALAFGGGRRPPRHPNRRQSRCGAVSILALLRSTSRNASISAAP
jgi:hypothetical protein